MGETASTSTDLVDETSDESFPASDPPAWTGTHAGPPDGESAGTLRSVQLATPFAETLARVERALVGKGMRIFARIDQAAEAQAVGLAMRPAVLFVFGSPEVGTPLMVARPTVAIDLPLKALVWEDETGHAWLTYNTPALLVERHGLAPHLAAKLAPVGELLERAVRGGPS